MAGDVVKCIDDERMILFPRDMTGELRPKHVKRAMDAREVAKHGSAESCWVVIHGEVYDVTSYISQHPGGATVLLRWAGKVRTFTWRTDSVRRVSRFVVLTGITSLESWLTRRT